MRASGRTRQAASRARAWKVPAMLALATAASLTAALVFDGAVDAAACLVLAFVLLHALGSALRRQRPATLI